MGGLAGRLTQQEVLNQDWLGHALGSTTELMVPRPTQVIQAGIKAMSGWRSVQHLAKTVRFWDVSRHSPALGALSGPCCPPLSKPPLASGG